MVYAQTVNDVIRRITQIINNINESLRNMQDVFDPLGSSIFAQLVWTGHVFYVVYFFDNNYCNAEYIGPIRILLIGGRQQVLYLCSDYFSTI